jgi:hypothetical protein
MSDQTKQFLAARGYTGDGGDDGGGGTIMYQYVAASKPAVNHFVCC